MNPTQVDISELTEDGQARAFSYTDPFGRTQSGVLLRWNGEFKAYRNICPHWSMPLDDRTGAFFDDAESVLQCDAHGARFDPATGECIMGPCIDQSLSPLRVEVDDDERVATVRPGPGLSA